MIFLEPEQRIAEQKVPNLVAAVVEDQRSPVLVLALSRIVVLVERRPVELRQPVSVFWKVSRHPIEDDADLVTMAFVNEGFEVFRRTETRGRRKKPDHLIAPGSGKRMFHHRQQLDVREAHLFDVRHELLRQLSVCEEPVVPLRNPPPRTQMDLVDRHRPVHPVMTPGPRLHPLVVPPLVLVEVPDDRSRRGRHLEEETERIRLLRHHAPVAGTNLELVALAVRKVGNEQLPYAVWEEQSHRMHAPIPPVEVSQHADPLRIRCPHGKVHAGRGPDGHPMSAQLVVRARVRPFTEQMEIEVRQNPPVSVRIVGLGHVAVVIGRAKPVRGLEQRLFVHELEQPCRRDSGPCRPPAIPRGAPPGARQAETSARPWTVDRLSSVDVVRER